MDFGGFGGSSKGSMRRKQSSSLLQALSGKSNTSRVSAIPIAPGVPNTAVSATSTSQSDDSHGAPYSPDDSYSSYSHSHSHSAASGARTTSINTLNGSGAGRGVSGTVASSSTMVSSSSGHGHGPSREREVKKLEDVIGLSKDRLLNWSYLMQWYGGDTHWLNTVKVRRELVEKELGPGKLDQRARQYFILGTSLAMLFDITVAGDFLRALYRLLEEWEVYCEKGAKGMKSLFKSQKAKKDKGELLEAESYLVYINLPFTPDFFSVHATTCSVIRDIYKKMLGMLLPNTHPPLPPGSAPQARHPPDMIRSSPGQSLLHPSTFIASAPTDLVFQANPHLSPSLAQQISNGVRMDDNSSMYSTPQQTSSVEDGGYTVGRGGRETPYGESAAGYPPDNGPVQRDAFEAYINGELPPSHSLIGDGQQVTPQIIETFIKVEAKLKKQFNLLVKEGDQFARKTLDDEIAYLLGSLNASAPMQFDYDAAMSGAGNGWQPSPPRSASISQRQRARQPSEPSTASSASFSIRRPSALVRHGSSDHGQAGPHPTHPWARSSADQHGDSEELEPAMEEHMRDEESPEERRERDFGTV